MATRLSIAGGTDEARSDSGVVRPDCVVKAGPVAVEVWDETIERLTAEGVAINSLDSRAIASYCMAWQRVDDAEEEIARDGITCTAKTGALYQHPAVGIANKAQEQILKLGAKLMLNPTDRKRGGASRTAPSLGVMQRPS